MRVQEDCFCLVYLNSSRESMINYALWEIMTLWGSLEEQEGLGNVIDVSHYYSFTSNGIFDSSWLINDDDKIFTYKISSFLTGLKVQVWLYLHAFGFRSVHAFQIQREKS